MFAGKSGEQKTTWCYRLWRVILLEPNMLKLTMRSWTSQINSMRVVWYQDLHRISWRSIHCPWHQDELGVSGIEEKTGVTTVVVSPWVYHCGYVRISVCGCALGWQVTVAVGQGFFMFLMMRCSGYARACRTRVRLLNSFCRMWSSEMIMLYRSVWE